MDKEFDILSLGSVYLDINFINFPIELLKPETEVVGKEYAFEIGGSAAISVKIAAALGLKPVFIGKIGNDIAGNILKDMFQKTGIKAMFKESPDISTNVNVNYVAPDGKNLFTAVGTANASFEPEEILSEVESIIEKVKVLYLGGGYFKLLKLQPYYKSLIKLAKENRALVYLDHGRIVNTATKESIQALKELLEAVDIYSASEEECLTLWETETIEEAIPKIRQYTQATILIKRGSKSTLAYDNTGRSYEQNTFQVNPTNTVGAGDSFNAGFIAAHLSGKPLPEAIKFANATAATKISREHLHQDQVIQLTKTNQ